MAKAKKRNYFSGLTEKRKQEILEECRKREEEELLKRYIKCDELGISRNLKLLDLIESLDRRIEELEDKVCKLEYHSHVDGEIL